MFGINSPALRCGTLAALLLGCTALTTTAPAWGQESTQRHSLRFDIAAKPLPQALAEFSAISGLRVLYTAEEPFHATSPGLAGNYAPEEALRRLLAGTGVTYRFTNPTTITLEKTPSEGALMLDPVTVEGAQGAARAEETARGPTIGYVAKRSASGTKTDTPLVETPQAISVVTREQLEDLGSRTVMQAMRYTPGAFTGQVGASNRYDYVILRGLTDRSIDNVYLDGLKMMGDDSTYSSMQVDPYMLERIDAVKGPSSVLYGRSSPGGLVDLTSKKPQFETANQMEVTYGSRNTRGIGFDLTGPLADNPNIAYRLVGTAHAADTQFEHAEEERYALMPSLTAKGKDTTLTVLAYLQKDPEGGTHNGVPADGTLKPRNGHYIDRDFFDGEPGWEKYERDQKMLAYQLEHRFSDTWTARQNFRFVDSGVDIDQVYQIGWSGSSNTLNRYYGGGHESLSAATVDNQLQADFNTGDVKHTLLGGLDYQTRKTKNDWMFGTITGINAFAPVYGNYSLSGVSYRKATRNLEQTGLYLQDQLAWNNWRLSLGGRQDWASTSNLNRLTNVELGEQRQKFTKRAGLLYLFDNGVAPYVSYAESFNPSLYTDAAGRPLKPTEGVQYETGIKYQPPGSQSMITAALFTIDQKNVAGQDPVTYVYSPAGTIRSRGLELEGKMQVTDDLRLMAGYTFTDASYAESPTGNQGNGATQVPKHMASLWADYAFGEGVLRHLSVGGGLRFVGESWADRANTTKVPAYTIADMSVRYDLEGLGWNGADFRLNATNLLDTTYVASCYELSNCYYGEERTVTGTLHFKF